MSADVFLSPRSLNPGSAPENVFLALRIYLLWGINVFAGVECIVRIKDFVWPKIFISFCFGDKNVSIL